MHKVTWNDLFSGTFKDLKKTYKLNDKQLENQVRSHLDGANAKDRRDIYKAVWDKKE